MMPLSPVRPFSSRTPATFAPRISPKPAFHPAFSGLGADTVRFGNSTDIIDAEQLERLMALAKPMIEAYVDTHFEANPQNSNVNNIIAGPYRQLLGEPVEANAQDPKAKTFNEVWTSEQKTYFKQLLKTQAPTILKDFKDCEKQRIEDIKEIYVPLAQDAVNQIYANPDPTHRVGFEKVYADLIQELPQPTNITRAAQARLESELKTTLWKTAVKIIPGLPDLMVGLSAKLKIFSSKAYLDAVAEAKQAPKVQRAKKAAKADVPDDDAPPSAVITKMELPPPYSNLILPDEDLKLLVGPLPSEELKKDRLAELRHHLPVGLVRHLENHRTPPIETVSLETGKLPSILYKGETEWKTLTESESLALENIQAIHPAKQEGREELKNMLKLVPDWIQEGILALPQATQDTIQDIHITYGNPVSYATIDKAVNELGPKRVTADDIDTIKSKIEAQGGRFNVQNRYTPDGALSRISRRPFEDGSENGYTFSIGRPLVGCYDELKKLIADDGNILVLGAPGSGKTSFLRDLLQTLSLTKNVELIDPSGEVAGSGRTPRHVGKTRVNYVARTDENGKRLTMQGYFAAITDKIYEVLQNLRAGFIARDEVRDGREAEAILSAGTRGVQIMVTAHAGSLKDFVHNEAMLNMTGKRGTAAVKDGNSINKGTGKIPTFRTGPCPFTTIIVLNKFKEGGGWQAEVIQNPDSEIDRILAEDAKRVDTFG